MSPVRSLPVVPASARLMIRPHAPQPASPAGLHDPALPLMTDFRASPAIAVGPDMSVDRALEHMILAGVRFCFVADREGRLVGTVTSFDLQGERVTRYLSLVGAHHRASSPAEVLVRHVMDPLTRLRAVEMHIAAHATVGEIVSTLRALATRHLVVVEERGDEQVLRGLFSATRIEQATGLALDILPGPATFAEIENAVEHPA